MFTLSTITNLNLPVPHASKSENMKAIKSFMLFTLLLTDFSLWELFHWIRLRKSLY